VPLRQPMLKGLLFRIANLLLSPSRP